MRKRIIEEPWTIVAADVLGPLPIAKARNQYLLKKIISRWGTLRIIHANNGYYPQVNPTERCNRSIKMIIRAYIDKNHKKWDENIEDFQFAINACKHASTQ